MDIIVAEAAGYCYGVERSLRLTREASVGSPKPIHTLGPIIHNPQVVQDLEDQGICAIRDLGRLDQGTVIVRCHGVDPVVVWEAREKGLAIIDATCPFVKKAQQRAAELLEEGYQVLILGERDHPEVIGILAHTREQALVVQDGSELPERLSPKIGVVVQTTQSLQSLHDLLLALLPRSIELKVHNTICDATTKRQAAAADLADQVDAMVVVGGHNSANTNRLVDVSKRTGTPTYHIETADEAVALPIWDCGLIGVTAGASTPDWVLSAVIERLRSR